MGENKKFEVTYERGKPCFWDNTVDLADCYLTCEDVVERLNQYVEKNKQLDLECERYEKCFDKDAETIRKLNEKNEKLKKVNLQLQEDLDYYKTKCGSLETALINLQTELEND